MNTQEIVTDEQIENEYMFTDFGAVPHRDILKQTLLKSATGFASGRTAISCAKNLGLLTERGSLTKKGSRYLYAAYFNC